MTSKAGHTAGPWTWTWENAGRDWAIVIDAHGSIVANVNTETGLDAASFPATRKMPAEANARLIAEAGTILHETGLTPRQLAERCEKLEAALKFYADRRRYDGANQKPIDGDCYAPANAAYMQDVTRDGGQIARAALAKATPGKLTDDEIVELTSREAALGPDKAGGA